ncbi:BamA/TamA family outer membrane protein [Robiginitalea aurantiaca]|uniref:BamA/TamA family outer membrane protein n=1 Tax=Robiginitalea aurantiaca TaxID=3056915 RepID=A0ABT7WIM4_9FLAO|nr:BamA/TamA family outer membrane protein [Robiginitalea aurantiaca]MDM9632765.1 BamA/TamA family outer membrane protein [Robiginitalea aurantiaca]
MRARWHVVKLPAKIGLFLVGLSFFSCNVLKRVEPDELLLTDFEVYADSVKTTNSDVQSLVSQKPNSRVLGIPLKLHLYNLAKPNPDSAYQDWLYRKENRYDRLEAILSQKQVERLGESFFVSGLSNGLKKAGEAPVVIDSSLTQKSLDRIRAYYNTKGYFNNTGSARVDTTDKQRASTRYDIDLGKPYIIDTISYRFSSPAVDSIYQLHKEESLVRSGEQFDLVNFTAERERLTDLFRNTGIWNFQESTINYDILRDTILDRDDQLMEVELNIENPRLRGGGQAPPYRVHRIDSVNIFVNYNFQDQKDSLQSITEDNFTIYYKDKLRYKPKALLNAVFLEHGQVYREIDRIRTYRQINNLNSFRYPNIELVDQGDELLTTNIYLSARPRNSLSLDLDVIHSNIQRIGIGVGAALVTRNVFGGAEMLSLNGRATFGFLSDQSLPEDFFTEISADINLIFPRIWMFSFVNAQRVIPNYMLPQSRISFGTTFQKNIGLDKQTLNLLLGYTWSPNVKTKNAFELLNIEYVRNLNPENFYNVYQSTYGRLNDIAEKDDYQSNPDLADFYEPADDPDDPQRLIIPDGTTGFTNAILTGSVPPQDPDDFGDVFRIEERRVRLTENNFIFSSNYQFTLNNQSDLNDRSFHQFRWRVETAGNILSAFAGILSLGKNEAGQNLLFGVPYSQYVKTEVEYIKHWALTATNVLAFRSFAGIAIPYGNADNIPFVRSYFAGGSNDNRAWFPYSLGPGSTDNINDFNEANFKLAFNLEYRFPIIGDLKGALFTDVGNIWNVWDQTTLDSATFSGFESLKDIAVGTGFGLRYDFSFFVFRADMGFKTYNPARIPSQRWFAEYNFANSVVQIGINYPF